MNPIMRDRDSVLTALKRYESFVGEAPIPVQIFRKYKHKEYLENETWIQLLIDGEHYISSYGRVATIQKNGRERIRSQYDYKGKNLKVLIDGREEWVHILTAKYFNAVGSGDKVIHLNRDYKDNKVDNLKFCTKREAAGFNKNVCRAKTKDKPLLQYTVTGRFLRRWNHVDDIVEAYNFRPGDILYCAEGFVLTAFNFIWVFEDPEPTMNLPVDKRVEMLKPYLIVGMTKDNKYVIFASLDEAERLTKISKYNVFKSCYLEGFEYGGWQFLARLNVRFKKGEYIWRESSED